MHPLDTDLIRRRSRRLLQRSRRGAFPRLGDRPSSALRDVAGATRQAAGRAASSARDAGEAVDAAVRRRTKRAAHTAAPVVEPPSVVEVTSPPSTRRSRRHLVPGLAKALGRGVVLALRNAPLIAAGAAGAAVSYLLDPESGRRRRAETADLIAAAARRERERIILARHSPNRRST